MEEVIKEYKLQSEKYDFEAEQKENLEILKFSNGLKRAAKEKQAKLDSALAKKKCLEEKKKNIVYIYIHMFHCNVSIFPCNIVVNIYNFS